MQGAGCGVQGAGYRMQCAGCRVPLSGLKAWSRVREWSRARARAMGKGDLVEHLHRLLEGAVLQEGEDERRVDPEPLPSLLHGGGQTR